jgi:alkylation response protein AidB-like acyl-CoA dehydrogenase
MLNTRGYAAAHVSRQWGGGGYSPSQQVVILQEWARHDAPGLDLFEISLYHVPSTFAAAGTPAQQARYVGAAIDGEIWCQGFSEPDAGSDLSGLKTRAVRDGEHFVINGQKLWSSHADDARFCLLLARTNPEVAPHRGITYFALDMAASGVEVRPIRQSNGHAGFCEIFLDNVRVNADCVIGEVDGGWGVAQSTLQAERGILGLDLIERMGSELRSAAAWLEERLGLVPSTGPLLAEHLALAQFQARYAAVQSLAYDTVELMEQGDTSGGLASLMKVSFTELLQSMMEWTSRLRGSQGLIDPGQTHFGGYVSGQSTLDWLSSWGWTIAGGTNEVQRNIIAERLLGLPRERRA